MKALLINPETKTIEPVDINGQDDITKMIGYDSVIADEIGPQGDQLFFDEECFLRGTKGRFQIDTVIPVSGKGVIVGSSNNGNTLQDVISDVQSIEKRIKYL